MDARNATVFREIHKNTWLKRLSVDNKKVLVGPKKSERSWVVFCVHDDCEALLEGYVEPRQAAQHTPEWTVPLQHARHVSHALVPSEHEYEFVITLPAEVVRFNAASWDIMQEWVDTLRQKLREMKIMSPKENLYSRLPELRAPLLPTRDPNSPLPAPPPVPAALVPGIERIVPAIVPPPVVATPPPAIVAVAVATTAIAEGASLSTSTITTSNSTTPATSSSAPTAPASMPASAMSNTLTQNLINMLSNPVMSAYHSQSGGQPQPSTSGQHPLHDNNVSLEDSFFAEDDEDDDDDDDDDDDNNESGTVDAEPITQETASTSTTRMVPSEPLVPSMARIFVDNVLADPNTCPAIAPAVSVAADAEAGETAQQHNTDTNTFDSLVFQSEPIIIPRPHTNRSSAREKTPNQRPRPTGKAMPSASSIAPSVAIVMPESVGVKPTAIALTETPAATNITIIQVSSPLIKPAGASSADTFTFPSNATVTAAVAAKSIAKIELADDQYKSNVQIIPSNSTPTAVSAVVDASTVTQPHTVTTVQVSGIVDAARPATGGYGKIKLLQHETSTSTSSSTTTVSTGGGTSAATTTTTLVGGAVTSIPIGQTTAVGSSGRPSQQYEAVFGSQNTTVQQPGAAATVSVSDASSPKPVPKQRTAIGTPRRTNHSAHPVTISGPSTSTTSVAPTLNGTAIPSSAVATSISNNNHIPSNSSANTTAGGGSSSSSSKIVNTMRENLSSPLPAIRKLLTRGLTDMSIQRPSRSRDPQPTATAAAAQQRTNSPHAPQPAPTARASRPTAAGPAAILSEAHHEQQRRRSSSHSEAQRGRAATARNNNNNNVTATGAAEQQPSHQQRPLVPKHSAPASSGVAGGGGGGSRMTLREQQVLELRKEMMHLGGVRIQLRRKDCQGSIALCDAFGAVWVCGWKQKDHPMLYYALHIGDQVVQVAGCSVGCTADVQRIIRNVQGLYIDFILRRLPFGRVYAIRREMDGQCLGLIRDGNTATIVDVVPKSLSARHGLPPKAQSCDGLSLTFWVLTEINGRPLNLFFKENEVRDRLNASGRDISVLVQPADLIAKLKKHLKSMRGYKEYIVQ